MAGALTTALNILLPKSQKKGGTALTGTYTPSNTTAVLAMPAYQDHLTDIYTLRQQSDSRLLIQTMMQQDPDVSAALSAYLTIAGANAPMMFARDLQGQIDPNGMNLLQQTMLLLTRQFDYTQGFDYVPSLLTICENMRYMVLGTGMIGSELVFDKNLSPTEIRHIDPQWLFWWEKTPGQYKPQLQQAGQIISLDIPSFFTSFYHRDPRAIYPVSPFVSAINTIAARQQVVNDLYRIMKITGYPRLDVKVLEAVVTQNMPADIRKNAEQSRVWLNARMSEIKAGIENVRPDQALVHWDSVEATTINDKAAGMALDISPIINVLNGQNQAALKVMATIIGRGESGVNTASVEARVFSMNCDEVNKPVAEILQNILTLALRLQGFQGYVDVWFKPVEMRPDMELENQYTMRSARLKQDLSLGLITDDEYHMQMYGRPAPAGAPKLQGTGFMQPQTSTGNVDPSASASTAGPGDQPNSLGRAAASPGGNAAKSNAVKTAPAKK